MVPNKSTKKGYPLQCFRHIQFTIPSPDWSDKKTVAAWIDWIDLFFGGARLKPESPFSNLARLVEVERSRTAILGHAFGMTQCSCLIALAFRSFGPICSQVCRYPGKVSRQKCKPSPGPGLVLSHMLIPSWMAQWISDRWPVLAISCFQVSRISGRLLRRPGSRGRRKGEAYHFGKCRFFLTQKHM